METLERLGISSEVICMFFGIILGWLIGIAPTLLKSNGWREGVYYKIKEIK